MKYKIFVIIFIVLLFGGCGKELTSSKNPYLGKEYAYKDSGQSILVSDEIIGRMYKWTEPVKEFYPKNFKVKGKHENRVFWITSKDKPLYILRFPNNTEILKVKFRITTDIEKIDNVEKAITKGIESVITSPFQLLGNLLEEDNMKFYQPYIVTLSYDNQKWNQFTLNKKLFSKDEDAYIIDKPFGYMQIKNVYFAIPALRGFKEKSTVEILYHPDELTFFVKDLIVEKEAVIYNLKFNKNKSSNENIIRYIAVNEPNFFRELQYKKTEFILDDFSILKLPNDVDINYGLNNFSKILQTGEYLATNRQNKTFDVNKIFSTKNISYNKITQDINDNSSSKELNLKNKSNKEVNFVDFDKGI